MASLGAHNMTGQAAEDKNKVVVKEAGSRRRNSDEESKAKN